MGIALLLSVWDKTDGDYNSRRGLSVFLLCTGARRGHLLCRGRARLAAVPSSAKVVGWALVAGSLATAPLAWPRQRVTRGVAGSRRRDARAKAGHLSMVFQSLDDEHAGRLARG